MATRRWSNKQGRYVTVENTERKRKSELIKAAVEARGLRASPNYRDDTYLTVSQKGWEVDLEWPRPAFVNKNGRAIPAYEPLVWGSVREDSFDELLAVFTDDLRYAQYVCNNRVRDLSVAQSEASYANNNARCAYERACVEQVTGRLAEGVTSQRLIELAAARSLTEAEFIEAHTKYLETQRRVSEYFAAMPQTVEEARAYLAALNIGEGG